MLCLVISCYALLYLYAKDRQTATSELFLKNIISSLNKNINEHKGFFNRQSLHAPAIVQSYQLVLFEPNGNTVNINSINSVSTFKLPSWSARSHDVQTLRYGNVLEAWRPLDGGYQLYVYIEFVPIYQTFHNPLYLLPVWLFFLFLSLHLIQLQKRYHSWYQLVDYSQNFHKIVQGNYQPLHIDNTNEPELLQLSQIVNRLSFKTSQYFDDIQQLLCRQQRLIDKSPTALFLINRKGRLLYFNEKFAHTFSTPFDKTVVYMLQDFIAGVDKATQQLLTQINEQSAFLTLSVTDLPRNDFYDLRLNPFYNSLGQLQGFSGSLGVVTNYHQQLQKAWVGDQQTAEKLAGFDKLWAVLEHELRTPLSGMMGMIELLAEDKADFNQEQQDTITTIQQSSKTMLSLLNDMLDVAKLDAGKLQLNLSSVNILNLLNQVAELMIGNAKRNNISLYIYTHPDVPRNIQTDDGRMRQIILNLMTNAIKFTKQGYVALLVDKVNSQHPVIQHKKSGVENLPTDWIKITVKDTGIGIAKKEQQKLFSYFNQANDSISQQFGGTGLGLAISNNFSQLLGGFIHLESEAGKGSEFQVFLPILENSVQPVFDITLNHFPILLIIVSPYDIVYRSTEILNFMNVHSVIFTTPNQAMIDRVNRLNVEGLQPIFVVDELSYIGNESIFSQIELFKISPKIIISMESERTISKDIMMNFDELVQKPPPLSDVFAKVMSLCEEKINPNHDKQLSAELAFKKFLQTHEAVLAQNTNVSTPNVDNHFLEDLTLPTSVPIVNQNKQILVAEDNATNQKIVKKQLEALGYTAIIANDGKEAIKLLNEHRADIGLVLMDCQMPIMDGLTATRQIRHNKDSIAIIALTANDTDADRNECSKAGMDGFITKPITKQKLTEILTRFMV
ncbi:response regulator [Faucicola mancuniensis]|uniref:response regulator n=1 Tax=Faucicola mancuniensis TaxID=1309795 RepID=UPI0039774B94